jgi:hypothetical protein
MDEARSRLLSVLSVCEHELHALEALEDERLTDIVEGLRAFHGELAVFLTDLEGQLGIATRA